MTTDKFCVFKCSPDGFGQHPYTNFVLEDIRVDVPAELTYPNISQALANVNIHLPADTWIDHLSTDKAIVIWERMHTQNPRPAFALRLEREGRPYQLTLKLSAPEIKKPHTLI
jgi:hypothetical protein